MFPMLVFMPQNYSHSWAGTNNNGPPIVLVPRDSVIAHPTNKNDRTVKVNCDRQNACPCSCTKSPRRLRILEVNFSPETKQKT
jgi:hypothetical protein